MRKLSIFLMASLYLSSLTTSSLAAVVSTFDTDSEGWIVMGDAPAGPDYHLTGGNPGGYLSADDYVSGGVWYWNAPVKFLGNQSAAFGQTLSFDLRQSDTSSPFDSTDVILTGNGITIVHDHAHPGTVWTSYSLTLDISDDWRIDTESGALATNAQIQSVLADLDVLKLRGEYRVGADTGSLDNVVLVPEPVTLLLLGFGGFALVRHRP